MTARARSANSTRSRCRRTPDEAQNYWWIRGKAAFLDRPPGGRHARLLERERWLTTRPALRASRQDLYARLRAAAEHGNSLKAPPTTDAHRRRLAGTRPGRRGTGAQSDARRARRSRPGAGAIPQHPANDSVLAGAATQLAGGDRRIPTRSPCCCRCRDAAEAVGVAVRDGFIAAYLEQRCRDRARSLRIYDVAAESAAAPTARRSRTAQASWSGR